MNEPGSLKPRALAVVDALARACCRTLTAPTIARHLGERDVTDLLWDMNALGLVEPVRSGRRTSWRLLVAGPVRS